MDSLSSLVLSLTPKNEAFCFVAAIGDKFSARLEMSHTVSWWLGPRVPKVQEVRWFVIGSVSVLADYSKC